MNHKALESLIERFPPMPDDVKLEFAGLTDSEVMAHVMMGVFSHHEHNPEELMKSIAIALHSLQELGFHRGGE